MDKKAILINFLVTFAAVFLAISLFAALHRPPRMQHPGAFQGRPQYAPMQQPMHPHAQMPEPGQQAGQFAEPRTNRKMRHPVRMHREQGPQNEVPAPAVAPERK